MMCVYLYVRTYYSYERFIKISFLGQFCKRGETYIISYHVLRVALGWELWVGTHNGMNDPLHDGIWQL